MTDEAQQGFYGQEQRATPKSDIATFQFICTQLINKLATVMLVQVKAVSNSGDVSPVGTVSVLPLVNQLSGDGKATPHATIVNVPYMRIQGGTNAIILDPQVGDIGLCAFAMRDISAVKSSKAQANPGSLRKYDWADGLYLGGFLNGTPEQFVQFNDDGVTIVSPTKISLQAPDVEIVAENGVAISAADVDITADSSIAIGSPDNTISGGNTKIDGKTFLTHAHSGVQSGGSNTGPVS